jgi:glycosyltransferase involved in cell wall biosynthesis
MSLYRKPDPNMPVRLANAPENTVSVPSPAARVVDRGPRLRVVFVIDNMRLGGTELNAVRTAERLDRDRFDLRVVCLGEPGPLTERYRVMGVPVVGFRLRSLYGATMLTTGLRFARYLRREGVQVVHAHDMYSNIFATGWARVARTPVVVASRRWWHSLPNRKLQLGNRAAFRLADAVLANSPEVARSVREEAGIAAGKVMTVTNFVDERAFVPPAPAQLAAMRRAWRVPAGAMVVGCVARLDPVKDHATLLRAVHALRARCPSLHLVLIGDGPVRAALEALAHSLELQDAVTFVGEVQDGRNHHHGFDISVLCSVSEGFPNTLVEAMAAGRPVVATAVGGSIDAVVDGETGLLVPPGSPEQLAESLARLVEAPALRQRLGDAGRTRAATHFGATETIARLERMYESLLAAAVR